MTGDCHAGIRGSRGLRRPRPPDPGPGRARSKALGSRFGLTRLDGFRGGPRRYMHSAWLPPLTGHLVPASLWLIAPLRRSEPRDFTRGSVGWSAKFRLWPPQALPVALTSRVRCRPIAALALRLVKLKLDRICCSTVTFTNASAVVLTPQLLPTPVLVVSTQSSGIGKARLETVAPASSDEPLSVSVMRIPFPANFVPAPPALAPGSSAVQVMSC